MATIKSYTDISQSKKLAEILPLESADMYYTTNCDWQGKVIGLLDVPLYIGSDGFIDTEMGEIYAWSLAALLNILKDKITFGGASDKDWFVSYTIKTPRKLLTIYKSNLVDACVAMIEKLNELNLL